MAQAPNPVRKLFGDPLNAAISVACLGLLAVVLPPLLRWAVLDATFAGNADTCRARAGACWAFIGEKFGMTVFGLYPFAERWRPAAVLAIFGGLVALSLPPAWWGRRLALAWVLGALAMVALMHGGFAGLPLVETRLWGGLTVTIFIAVFGIALGYPLGILLALGRRSRVPVLHWLSVAAIELVRGVPLISLVFMAAVLGPLLLPASFDLDRLVRVQLAYALFAGAYLAEVFRGGLQGVPAGQEEAAKALGLRAFARMRLVVLPQALRQTIPAQMNTFVVLLKDTTLVVIVGVFDFFTTVRAAMGDSRWLGFSVEAYLYAAAMYLVICFALSRYSRFLEHRLRAGHGQGL